jgi:SAM-dependent methyltransferase
MSESARGTWWFTARLLLGALGLSACATDAARLADAHLEKAEAAMFAKSTDYEQLMGRWSRRLSPLHLQFARVKDGDRVLDVGCGTGALASTLASMLPAAQVVGVDPSPDFIAYAQTRATAPGTRFEVGDAQALGFGDATFDVVLAQLVMNFIPDHLKAAREMRRVTRPGGVVSACVWGYDEGMDMLRFFWDEVVALDPAMASKDERTMKLSRKGQLGELWREAGLINVVEAPLEIELSFTSFDDYWKPFLKGAGPAGAYVVSLNEEARGKIEARLRRRLLGDRPDGGFTLKARAWCARGQAPEGPS